MEEKIFHILGLVLALSCVIIVAKNESEKTLIESKNSSSILNTTNLNQNMYSDGGSIKITTSPDVESAEEPKKSKVKGRKGVSFEDLKTPEAESAKNSTEASVTVQINNSTSSSNETSKLVTNAPISNKTAEIPHAIATSTIKLTEVTTRVSSTTKKPIRKPTITLSADDDPAIKESEKNINLQVSREKGLDDPPKLEQDVDRAVLEEKRARKSYMTYLGFAVVLPLTLVALNLAYKRVKNYLELREYQRVDFLVDGMYVS